MLARCAALLPAQAGELALRWRPIGEITLTRGFVLATAAAGHPDHIRARLGEDIARCLGADEGDVPTQGPVTT